MPARPLRTLILVALALVGLTAAPARAGLVLTAKDSSASQGGTGSFEVVLSSNDGSFDVSGFSFALQVATGSGVLFTDATTTGTSPPYIFGTLQVPPFTTSTLPGTSLIASDSSQTSPYFTTVTPQIPYSLGRVTYSVAPGTAPGPVMVSFVGTTGVNRTTEVLDINGDPFPLTTNNGTITVANVNAVPEPGSTRLILAGLGTIAGYAVRRRRRATRA